MEWQFMAVHRTYTFTPRGKFEPSIQSHSMFLGDGMKTGNSEVTHTDTGRTSETQKRNVGKCIFGQTHTATAILHSNHHPLLPLLLQGSPV